MWMNQFLLSSVLILHLKTYCVNCGNKPTYTQIIFFNKIYPHINPTPTPNLIHNLPPTIHTLSTLLIKIMREFAQSPALIMNQI